MKKQPFIITLENPCQQNWDLMPRQQGGLYCGDCKKVVHDFSILSDEEIIRAFTQKRSGEICGKFRIDQLNRNLLPATGNRLSFRPLKILMLSLFTLKFISPAKASPDFKSTTNYTQQKFSTKVPQRISGQVTDILTGIPLPQMNVSLVGHNLSTTTDSTGHFQLLIPDSITADTLILSASSSDYWMPVTTVSRKQLPFVVNLRMTKVVQIVSLNPIEIAQPAIIHLGGVPPREIGQIREERITYPKLTFWQKIRFALRKKQKN